MDVQFLFWFLTLHAVNVALYLAVTRMVRGWVKTLLGLAVYLGAVTFIFCAFVRYAGGNPKCIDTFGFPVGFGAWLAATMVMSRGPLLRSLFAAVLCGAHQLTVNALCNVMIQHVRPPGFAVTLAIVLMAGLAVVLIRFLLPRVWRISPSVDWRLLDVFAFLLLALIYVCGFYPIWVPDGPWLSAVPFAVSVLVLLFFFPIVFHLSEKCQATACLTQAEDNMRLLAEEVRVRREAVDAARRQRHDLRHHRIVIAEHLLRGHVDRALGYLERLDAEADRTPTDKLIWCANDTINAILSGLSRKAKAKSVGFEVEANVGPEIDVPDIDIVTLIANLVENAINAAAGRTPDSRVVVALRQREQTFGMTVTNPAPPGVALSEKGLPCAEPGVGLGSVLRVIERYRGELVYTLADGFLECQALLKINESSAG